MGWLALLFIVVPVIELALLIELGGILGLLPTVALIIFTGVVGAGLAKQQGLNVLMRFQEATRAGKLPGDAIVDGAIILFSGALLLTPGILTDFVGFIGLIPPARAALKRAIRASLKRAVERGDVRMNTFVVGTPPPGFRPEEPFGGAHHHHTAGPGRVADPAGPVIDVTPESGSQPKSD